MILNCIAIDDEPLALGLITTFIKQTPYLNLLGAFSNAKDIFDVIEKEQIHVVFLDIQMPKLNGIELANLLHNSKPEAPIRVIFTTAYNQFAVESYRVDALDYLLKPFEYEDFLNAAKKALSYYEVLAQQTKSALLEEEYIFVRVDYQLVKILCADIIYIEGLKDYVKIHLTNSDKPILTLATLKSLTEKLPKDKFIRVQRSFIISLNKISAITKSSIWIDTVEISIGEQYKKTLNDMVSKLL